MTVLSKIRGLGLTLIIYPAFGTAQGRQLNLEEKGQSPREAAETNGTNTVDYLVIFNVSTDLDMATVDMVLDLRVRGSTSRKNSICVIAVSSFLRARADESTRKASALDGPEPGVLPAQLTRTFAVASANGKRISVSGQQLPIIPVYHILHRLSCSGSDDQILCGRHRLTIEWAITVYKRRSMHMQHYLAAEGGQFTGHPNEHLREEGLDHATKIMKWDLSRSDRSVYLTWSGRIDSREA